MKNIPSVVGSSVVGASVGVVGASVGVVGASVVISLKVMIYSVNIHKLD